MGTGRLYVFGVFAAILALSGLAGATSVKKSGKPGLASASQYETNNMGVDPVSDVSDAEVEQALKVAGKSSDALNWAISKSKKQKQKRAGTVRAQAKAQQRGDFVVDSYEQQMYRSMEKLGFRLRTADLHMSELEGASGSSEAAGECVECQLPGHGGGGDKPGGVVKRFGAQKVSIIGEDDRVRYDGRIPSLYCVSYGSDVVKETSAVAINLRYGLLWSVSHTALDLGDQSSIKEQISTIPDRCKILVRDERGGIAFEAKIIGFEVGNVIGKAGVTEFLPEDDLRIRIAGPIKGLGAKNSVRPFEGVVNKVGVAVSNFGYHHIPDNKKTSKNEEAVGRYKGAGTIWGLDGGGLFRYSSQLFRHDIDVNTLSSGSGIYASVLVNDKDGKRKYQDVLIGLQVGYVGEDFAPYDDLKQFNVGKKFTSETLDSFKRLMLIQ